MDESATIRDDSSASVTSISGKSGDNDSKGSRKYSKDWPRLKDDKCVDGLSFIRNPDIDDKPIWGDTTDNLWASGESLMIFGPPGAGKSTMVQLLVWGLLGLNGSEVIDWPIAPVANNIMYLAMDRPKQVVRSMRRFDKPMSAIEADVLNTRLDVRKGYLPLDICKNHEWLAEEAIVNKYSVIIIDSLKDVVSKLSDEDLAFSYNKTRQICIENGIEIIELHHNRKSNGMNKEPNTLDDVYGSRWLTAGTGSIISLFSKTEDNTVLRMKQLRAPSGTIEPVDLVHDKTAGQISKANSNGSNLTIETVLRVSTNKNGMSAKEVTIALGEDPKEAVEKNRAQLNRMIITGVVEKVNIGKDVRFRLVDSVGATA